MEEPSLYDLLTAHFMPLLAILLILFCVWVIMEALRTGRANGKGGVAYRDHAPIMFWMNVLIPAMVASMMTFVAGSVLLAEMPLPRLTLMAVVLAVCVWQGLPWLRQNFWGKLPGDYTASYRRSEELYSEEEVPATAPGAVTVLTPLGSILLTGLFLFALYRAALRL